MPNSLSLVSLESRWGQPEQQGAGSTSPLTDLPACGTIAARYGDRANDEPVTIKLTHDQALVLSDWLYAVTMSSDQLNAIVPDRAAWRRCGRLPTRSTKRCHRSSRRIVECGSR